MLVLIMAILLMSLSHFLFCWFFDTVLISVVSVVAAGQSQKVRLLISRFPAFNLDTFLHIHVSFSLYNKKKKKTHKNKKVFFLKKKTPIKFSLCNLFPFCPAELVLL